MPDTLANEHSALMGPQPVKLTVADFLLLKRAGVFASYSKSELLDGKLWGVEAATIDRLAVETRGIN